MAGVIFNLPNARQLSLGGSIMPGFKAKFFLSGTLTPAPVYADADLTTPLGAVVQADLDGHMRAIYLDSAVSYRVQITDANDVLQPDGDVDPVRSADSGGGGGGSMKFVLANVQADGSTFGSPLNVDNITVEGAPDFNIYFIEFATVAFANIPTVTATVIGIGKAIINDLADPNFCRIATVDDAGAPLALPFSVQIIGQ